nr:hypothetical protein [Tanacetum cinerariifolium]
MSPGKPLFIFAKKPSNIFVMGQNCSFPGEMSPEINLSSPQPGQAESTSDRVHSRAVAVETQPKMSADVARSHGGDGGGKGKRKPNLGGRAAGRLNTRDKTQNLSLKEIMDKKGPVPIQFELSDKQTVMPLGDHAAHWSSYIGDVIRENHREEEYQEGNSPEIETLTYHVLATYG